MDLRKRAIRISGCLALLSCVAARLLATESVPLSGELKGTYSITQLQTSPPFYAGHSVATGNVQHLGKASLTVDGASTIDAAGNIVPVPGTWSATLTAANGDHIFLSYKYPVNDNASGKYTLSGKYTITGGTGRFAGATGEGTYSAEGTYSLIPGQVNGEFAGSLDGAISTKTN